VTRPLDCFVARAPRNDGKPLVSVYRAAVRPSGLVAPRMLCPLGCFVARAPRNDEAGHRESNRPALAPSSRLLGYVQK
jgi:hypothetical protein